MRIGIAMLALSAFLGLAHPAAAATTEGADYKGIWVSTPFPAFNTAAGETVTLDLTVHNSGLAPQPVELKIGKSPTGWKAVFLGEGKRVQSVFVAPDGEARVKLRLEPSAQAAEGTHRFDVIAAGADSRFSLPIELTLGQSLPPKLSLKPELPELRGAPTSDFEFKVAIRNDGGEDATVRLDAETPAGFRVKLTEQFGSQELTSLPLKVGEEKTVSVKITPPYNAKEGSYPVIFRTATGKAQARARLTMELVGQSKLTVTGANERLSASAEAGEETPVDIVLANTGSAAAHDVKMDVTAPSGWKVTFEPERIDALEPNDTRTVKALVVPSKKAIAGDYMMTVRAVSGGTNESSDFRITVRTSTLWGVVGVLVIAAALVVLVVAMQRYGRR